MFCKGGVPFLGDSEDWASFIDSVRLWLMLWITINACFFCSLPLTITPTLASLTCSSFSFVSLMHLCLNCFFFYSVSQNHLFVFPSSITAGFVASIPCLSYFSKSGMLTKTSWLYPCIVPCECHTVFPSEFISAAKGMSTDASQVLHLLLFQFSSGLMGW